MVSYKLVVVLAFVFLIAIGGFGYNIMKKMNYEEPVRMVPPKEDPVNIIEDNEIVSDVSGDDNIDDIFSDGGDGLRPPITP